MNQVRDTAADASVGIPERRAVDKPCRRELGPPGAASAQHSPIPWNSSV
ncbi:hypothetical protein AB5J49_00660 [Streptomyces sp. R28]|uniref:Uncharacterized protein n=1 Tax=Streptomyces sp. R28 TaxID=3238628 RepID=A0AB39PNT8_9ACTN